MSSEPVSIPCSFKSYFLCRREWAFRAMTFWHLQGANMSAWPCPQVVLRYQPWRYRHGFPAYYSPFVLLLKCDLGQKAKNIGQKLTCIKIHPFIAVPMNPIHKQTCASWTHNSADSGPMPKSQLFVPWLNHKLVSPKLSPWRKLLYNADIEQWMVKKKAYLGVILPYLKQ